VLIFTLLWGRLTASEWDLGLRRGIETSQHDKKSSIAGVARARPTQFSKVSGRALSVLQ
jgi:hypothetical protein